MGLFVWAGAICSLLSRVTITYMQKDIEENIAN